MPRSRLLSFFILLMLVAFSTNAFASDPYVDKCFYDIRNNNYVDAVESGTVAISTAPEAFDSHYCLAEALRLTGENEHALQELQQAEQFAKDKSTQRQLHDSFGIIFM